MKERQEEEKVLLAQKRVEGKKLLEEVLAANEDAIRRKQEKKLEEKRYEEKIAQCKCSSAFCFAFLPVFTSALLFFTHTPYRPAREERPRKGGGG